MNGCQRLLANQIQSFNFYRVAIISTKLLHFLNRYSWIFKSLWAMGLSKCLSFSFWTSSCTLFNTTLAFHCQCIRVEPFDIIYFGTVIFPLYFSNFWLIYLNSSFNCCFCVSYFYIIPKTRISFLFLEIFNFSWTGAFVYLVVLEYV